MNAAWFHEADGDIDIVERGIGQRRADYVSERNVGLTLEQPRDVCKQRRAFVKGDPINGSVHHAIVAVTAKPASRFASAYHSLAHLRREVAMRGPIAAAVAGLALLAPPHAFTQGIQGNSGAEPCSHSP